MKFKFLEGLTSDVVFEAYGKDLKELFENAALALFTVMCDVKKVEAKLKKDIEVSGEDVKDLLYNWLQQLIALVDIEGLFLSKFEVKKISENKLKAKVYGEKADPKKGITVVKAVTYYKFNLEKISGGYKATVALDI
ncbi:MAG: archease [Candidatus Aenigmatarchaeota archaeon]